MKPFGTFGLGVVKVKSSGHKWDGMVVSVFHRFDDGRVNVQKLDKYTGQVSANMTLNPNEFVEEWRDDYDMV